jgi:hypothetical protein
MTAAAPVMVHMRHVRQAKLCSSGMRTWAEAHGFNALHFIRHGIEAEKLEATGDYYGIQVAQFARAEAAAGQK